MSRRRRKAAYTAAAAAAMSEGPLGFSQRLALIPRLVRDTLSGRYDGLTPARLGMMALAVLYIILPIDVLPEAFLTIPGLADDAAVAAWLIASLMGATTAYRAWESGFGATAPTAPSGSFEDIFGAPAGASAGAGSAAPGVIRGEVITH